MLDLIHCVSCGNPLTERYQPYGVCNSCWGTTDDPMWPERRRQ